MGLSEVVLRISTQVSISASRATSTRNDANGGVNTDAVRNEMMPKKGFFIIFPCLGVIAPDGATTNDD